MDQREAMVVAWLSGRYTVAEVAARYEVSRPTVYTWAARYRAAGRAGLRDRPPIARSCPHQTPAALEQAILQMRAQYGWGPKKLRVKLCAAAPATRWPPPSTIGAILARHGAIRPRRRRRHPATPFRRKFVATAAGELLTADFKGQFRLGNGQYCFPLTVMDATSRYLLACEALPSTALPAVWAVFERVFRAHGVPRAIQTDNGVPFVGTRGLARISWLSVQFMKLGIQPVLIDPGHPEQNGAHERMHRTLAAAATRPPSAHARAQQHRFDQFRQVYNHERPHEALGQTPPAAHFAGSPRPYPTRLRPMEYAGPVEVRIVSNRGRIRFRGREWFVSSVLTGERLGLAPVADAVWALHFGAFELGRLDERTGELG